jgi:hypothetical protein
MTELETVLLCALGFMLFMYYRAERKAKYYQFALVAVGLNKATVIIDEDDKSFTIDVDVEGLKKRIS